ncbi:LysR substrate-binding domain-containing protein [Lutimaribacter marinistellae]|uniref:LysR substrate-binding domain-containing protein n=1 Tax=Lutimaribacter marinistellae TaxID=1820329 RepID=A0ABV7TBI1_9RHOB
MHDGPPIHLDDALQTWWAVSENTVRANGVVVDAPFLQKDQVSASEVCDVALVGRRLPHGLRLLLERWSNEFDAPLNFTYEADAPSVLVRFAASGACYSIVCKAAVAYEIAAGTLGTAEIVTPTIERTVCLASSKRLPPDIAPDAIFDLVKEIVPDLVHRQDWPDGKLAGGFRGFLQAKLGRYQSLLKGGS